MVLRVLAAQSQVPVLELDVSDGAVPALAERVADWLESTGGLWAPSTEGHLLG